MKTIIAILTLGTFTFLLSASKAQDPVPPDEALRRQAEAAQRQAEDARRSAEEAKRAGKAIAEQRSYYEDAQDTFDQLVGSTGGAGGGGFTLGGNQKGVVQLFQDMNPGDGIRGPGRSLLIHNLDLDPENQARLEEDLAVMSHILDKVIGNEVGRRSGGMAMGIGVIWDNAPRSTRSIYLEDYGVLFLVNVSLPLLPGPKPEVPKEKNAADSAWEEARQELFGPHDLDGKPGRAREEYDEAKVNKLKDALMEALKDASNIHQLKQDDWITVCVTGGAGVAPAMVYKASPGRQPSASLRAHNSVANRSTTLTLRVKKSDVDSFARQKISSEEFRKKVKVSAYALDFDDSPAKAPWFSGYAGGRY